MPRDGSGNYTKPGGSTAVTGTTISSTAYNALINDLESDANIARPISAGGTGAASKSAARTSLGLEIGTDVQAYNANLASLSGLTLAAGDLLYATGADTLVKLAKGTAGQVLQMNSGATAPEWVDVLAVGQTWQDMSGSRSLGTNYTNSTGRPIVVCVTATANITANLELIFTVDSVEVGRQATGGNSEGSITGSMQVIVPDGGVYNATAASSTLIAWAELR